ncbi:MAG: glycerol-3-phosphate dehydrogenase C-terminal domain-containing protein, partial [Anaerolineaceae bacterium]
PGLEITRERVRYAYAGLRPLQKVSGGPEAAISRRHELISHETLGGARGVFSVVGGKLSTFRPLAEEVAERLNPPRQRTEREESAVGDWVAALRATELTLAVKNHLRVYGAAIGQVVDAGRDVICPHSNAIAGEVLYSAANECVETLSDLMMRRTGISWGSCRGLCCHLEVAKLAGGLLGWDATEQAAQAAAFESEVAYHLPTEEMLRREGD